MSSALPRSWALDFFQLRSSRGTEPVVLWPEVGRETGQVFLSYGASRGETGQGDGNPQQPTVQMPREEGMRAIGGRCPRAYKAEEHWTLAWDAPSRAANFPVPKQGTQGPLCFSAV